MPTACLFLVHESRIKIGAALAVLAGLSLAIGLIAWQGAGVIAQSVLAVGWGIVPITLFHLLPLVLTAFAWRMLLAWHVATPLWVYVRARWIRQHVSYLLPVAQVGGEIVGARLLILRGLAPALAGASVVVDLTLEAVTQLLFTLIGLGLLVAIGGGGALIPWIVLGSLIAALGLAVFVLAQRYGLFGWIERRLAGLAARWSGLALGQLSGLQHQLRRIYQRPGAIAGSGVYHLVGWIAGSGEIWLALYFIGQPVGIVDAVMLESLGEAIRSAAFMIPGQLGVQEGAYMLLVQLVGLSPQAGLTLSLIKRVRVLILGLPALLTWQVIESRQLSRRS